MGNCLQNEHPESVQCFAMKKNTQSMSTRPIVTLDIVLDDGWTTIIRWSCPWQSDASGRTTRTSQVGRSSGCSLGRGVTLGFLWNATWEKHPEKGEKRMLQLATSNRNNLHVWPEKSGKTGPQDAIAAKNIAKSTDDVTWDKTSWITIQLNPLLFQPENTTVRVPEKHPKPYLWASGRSNDIDIAASTRKTALGQVEQHFIDQKMDCKKKLTFGIIMASLMISIIMYSLSPKTCENLHLYSPPNADDEASPDIWHCPLGHPTETWVLKFSANTRKTKLKSGLAGLRSSGGSSWNSVSELSLVKSS